jgi:hypothetical protein
LTNGSSLEKVRSALFRAFVPVMFLPTVALVSFGLVFDAGNLLGNITPSLALLGTGVLLFLVFFTFIMMVLEANRDHPLFGNTALERAYNWLHIRAWLGCSCAVDAGLAVLFFLVYLLHQSSFSGPPIIVAITLPIVVLVSIHLRAVFASYLGAIHKGHEPDLRLHASSLAVLSSVLLNMGDERGTGYLEGSVRVYNQFLHDVFASSPSVDRTIAVLSYLPQHGSHPHLEEKLKLAAALSDPEALEFVRLPEYCAAFNANFDWLDQFEKPKIAVPKKGLRGYISKIPPQALPALGGLLALILGLFPALLVQLFSARILYTLIILAVFSIIPALLAADSMFPLLGQYVPPWRLSEMREAAFVADH